MPLGVGTELPASEPRRGDDVEPGEPAEKVALGRLEQDRRVDVVEQQQRARGWRVCFTGARRGSSLRALVQLAKDAFGSPEVVALLLFVERDVQVEVERAQSARRGRSRQRRKRTGWRGPSCRGRRRRAPP